LPSIQFIREGEFTAVQEAPTLRLIGNVEPTSELERERVKVIRESVTPDAVLLNFLSGTPVAEPLQYIHAQAHFQRKWLPVWHYVQASNLPVQQLIEELKTRVASHPSSRDALVRRLRRVETAHKVHPGKPQVIRKELIAGRMPELNGASAALHAANAVMSLVERTSEAGKLKELLLSCLAYSKGDDPSSSARRSSVYRAACRLDELLHAPSSSDHPTSEIRTQNTGANQ
jgi:hypothetical protein